jgi:hypothetical protein
VSKAFQASICAFVALCDQKKVLVLLCAFAALREITLVPLKPVSRQDAKSQRNSELFSAGS